MDIRRNCWQCQGTGQVSNAEGSNTCIQCGGSGRLDVGEIGTTDKTLDERLTEMEDKVDDIKTVADAILTQVS